MRLRLRVVDAGASRATCARAFVAAIAGHGRRLDPVAYSQRPLGQRTLCHIAYALMRLAILVAGQRYWATGPLATGPPFHI